VSTDPGQLQWLLGSFAVLSLLYRADTNADPAAGSAAVGAELAPASAEPQRPGAEVLTKRAQAERIYADLSAEEAPVSAGQLAAAAGLSRQLRPRPDRPVPDSPPAAADQNGHRPAAVATDTDPEARP
jgi:hypothetical protein